jgi:hypothetical protein
MQTVKKFRKLYETQGCVFKIDGHKHPLLSPMKKLHIEESSLLGCGTV